MLGNLDLYPLFYLFHSHQCIQFLVALIGIDHPLDFLDTSQHFEEVLIKLLIGRILFPVVDDVPEHLVVGVVLSETSQTLHELLLRVCPLRVPFVVDGEYEFLEVLQPQLGLAEFVDLYFRYLLVDL